MPWPLERLVRQYVGFHALVTREYSDLIEYIEEDDQRYDGLVEKRSAEKSVIAQWRIREYDGPLEDHYIYHFRYIFDKNWNCVVPRTEDSISLPPKLYMDIVKHCNDVIKNL